MVANDATKMILPKLRAPNVYNLFKLLELAVGEGIVIGEYYVSCRRIFKARFLFWELETIYYICLVASGKLLVEMSNNEGKSEVTVLTAKALGKVILGYVTISMIGTSHHAMLVSGYPIFRHALNQQPEHQPARCGVL